MVYCWGTPIHWLPGYKGLILAESAFFSGKRANLVEVKSRYDYSSPSHYPLSP